MKQLIEHLKGVRIAVVGDVMLDAYVFGDSTRVSPEAPVPVIAINREEHRAGGAANVAHNVTSLGGDCLLIGQIGDDYPAKTLSNILEYADVRWNPVRRSDFSTIEKTRVIARGQQMIRVDRERVVPLPDQYIHQIIDDIVGFEPDAIIISDYAKGIITSPLCSAISDLGKSLLIDPKPGNIVEYGKPTLICPNEAEALMMSKQLDVRTAGKWLADTYGCGAVITRGPKGVSYFGVDSERIELPTQAHAVFDVSGAGDTFIASLAMCQARRYDIKKSLRFANTCSGIVVEKVGTAVVTPSDLDKYTA